MKKRVYTLYRVSTIGQVEKDDIPMQKEACHEFAERQGWEIVKEFSEKGVSGFKKSAKDRDQLQLLQQAAAAGEFDVLLVYSKWLIRTSVSSETISLSGQSLSSSSGISTLLWFPVKLNTILSRLSS